MLRNALVVSAATAAAVVASALPAQAAIPPYCATPLAATAAGQSSTCNAAHPNVNGLILRRFDFEVTAGTVTASTTCGPSTKTATVTGPGVGSVQMSQPRGTACSHTLTAVTAPAAATGVSTYVVMFV